MKIMIVTAGVAVGILLSALKLSSICTREEEEKDNDST